MVVFNSYSVEELQETTDMDGLLAELNSNQRDRWLEWEIRPQESPYPQLVKMVHLSQCSITVSPDSFVQDGIEKYPDVKVTYGDKELVQSGIRRKALQNQCHIKEQDDFYKFKAKDCRSG